MSYRNRQITPAKARNLGERIVAMLQLRGMSQRTLAEGVGMSQQSMNYLCNPNTRGDANAKSTSKVFEIAEALGCDAQWLATGRGDPTPDGEPRLSAKSAMSYARA